MEGAAAVIVILILLVIGFMIFVVYFVFKLLQFVIMAINLYKKMVNRQDATIKLLLDIRDNTKRYDAGNPLPTVSDSTDLSDEKTFVCENCKAEVPSNAKKCPKCGAEFE
jgi:hypothetical protein